MDDGHSLHFPKSHVAFLSSLSGAFKERREEIHAASKPLLWVAEKNKPELAGKPSMEIVDACIEALSSSELFICLLIGNGQEPSEGGTLIKVGEIEAHVSYFEIEVFAAAARGLPIVFLETKGFAPGERLAEWLTILERSAVPIEWIKDCNEITLAGEVKKLIARLANFKSAQAVRSEASVQRLAMDLVTTRGRIDAVRRGKSDVLWSSRNRVERTHSDDEVLQRARTLLGAAEDQDNPNKKLGRLYLVFRELFARPYDLTKSPDLLNCWNDALGQWWGASSWYGLHSHLSMGTISTLWTQDFVRAKLVTIAGPSAREREDLYAPHGPLASSYYSLGKLLAGDDRRTVLRTSLDMTEKVIKARKDEEPTIFAVRGCVQFLLGQPLRSMASFYTLLRLGRRNDSIFLTAEAHSYLGRAYAKLRCMPLARSHLNESITAWKGHVEAKGKDHAFYIKALKNLAAFQESRGDLSAVLENATQAHKLAIEHGVFDQARQLEEVLVRVRMKAGGPQHQS